MSHLAVSWLLPVACLFKLFIQITLVIHNLSDKLLPLRAVGVQVIPHIDHFRDFILLPVGLAVPQKIWNSSLLSPFPLKCYDSLMANLPPIEEFWKEKKFEPNEAQRKAILHTEGPLFLTAGPGSGKTRVLLWRTLNLLVYHDVKPEEIFLSTFTEKAGPL